MSQADLERASGVKSSTIKSIYQGKSQSPRGDNLRKLADALECTAADLVADAPVDGLPDVASDGSPELLAPADRYEPRSRDPAAMCRMVLSCIELERWADALQWAGHLKARLAEIRQEHASDVRKRQGV